MPKTVHQLITSPENPLSMAALCTKDNNIILHFKISLLAERKVYKTPTTSDINKVERQQNTVQIF